MKLTGENVHLIFLHCLFKEDEPTENHKVAEGVKLKIGFHPERLKESEQAIAEMLDCLHDNFKKSGGGGWTFLNMCEDKDGELWTGVHAVVDELVTLGIATGKMSFLLPRENWEAFPSGLPYVVVN